MARPIVIYYDGNENRTAWGNRDYPDSSVPRVHGLPDDADIIAVIDPGERTKEDDCAVYIDECIQIMEGVSNVE